MNTSRQPEIVAVDPDQYLVVRTDTVLRARLEATFILCFYDAVQESGAVVHLRSGPAGRALDADLTDTTLSSDLLLIDRCLEQLRVATPRAQHWQARIVAQVADGTGAHARFNGIRELLTGFLEDSGVTLVSCEIVTPGSQFAYFRPTLGKAWVSSA